VNVTAPLKEKAEPSPIPKLESDYSYTISVTLEGPEDQPQAVLTAKSIFGAMSGFESFMQLVDPETGSILRSEIEIDDSPQYRWRGY